MQSVIIEWCYIDSQHLKFPHTCTFLTHPAHEAVFNFFEDKS